MIGVTCRAGTLLGPGESVHRTHVRMGRVGWIDSGTSCGTRRSGSRSPGRGAGLVGDDRLDRYEKPPALLGQRHRQDPCPALSDKPLQPAGVLLGAELADHRQDEVAPIALKTHRAGGEADRPRSRRRALKRGTHWPGWRPALASDYLPAPSPGRQGPRRRPPSRSTASRARPGPWSGSTSSGARRNPTPAAGQPSPRRGRRGWP